MAHIKSGQLYLNKKDLRNFNEMRSHITLDMSYGDGGTFGEEREVRMVEEALDILDFIIQSSKLTYK